MADRPYVFSAEGIRLALPDGGVSAQKGRDDAQKGGAEFRFR